MYPSVNRVENTDYFNIASRNNMGCEVCPGYWGVLIKGFEECVFGKITCVPYIEASSFLGRVS